VKLLVTGGAGYIGSVVAHQLLEAGHETVVLDNLSKGYEGAVPEGARFLRCGLLDAEEVPILETSPALPTSPYGGSKLAVDRRIGAACKARGLAATSLRYFIVAGASGRFGEAHDPETHLIPLVLQTATGMRDWEPEKPELEAMISDAWDWMQAHPNGYE
jgi:UDP-glucose 4-epimerase